MGFNRITHIDHRIRDIIQRFQTPISDRSFDVSSPEKYKASTDQKFEDSVSTPASHNNRFPDRLEELIQRHSRENGVSPHLVQAIIDTESSGKPGAVSRRGAIGLMQLMPDTARSLGVNPKIPEENLKGGIEYLKHLAGRYGDLDKTLAAYNAGPGNVDKYGGVPPFPETRNYIKRVRSYLENLSVDEKSGHIRHINGKY